MDLFEVIEERRSIREFKPEPVPTQNLKKNLKAGRLAPSGSNRQPWHFIVVRDLEAKRALSTAANNQKLIGDADIVITVLGDPETSTKLPYKLSSTRIPHKQDPMIVIEHMSLAATALEYRTCWIGAFDEDEVKRILKISENVSYCSTSVGIPDESPGPRTYKTIHRSIFQGILWNFIEIVVNSRY